MSNPLKYLFSLKIVWIRTHSVVWWRQIKTYVQILLLGCTLKKTVPKHATYAVSISHVHFYPKYPTCLGGSVGCVSDWWWVARGFDSRRFRQHSFVEIVHGILSTVILFHWFKKGSCQFLYVNCGMSCIVQNLTLCAGGGGKTYDTGEPTICEETDPTLTLENDPS